MNRRGFIGAVGAVLAAPAVLSLDCVQAVEAHRPTHEALKEVSAAPAGSVHFAVLMDMHGRPCHTMMVQDLPQEIHITQTATSADVPPRDPGVFKLVSKDRYDGRTIPGLARYIHWSGHCPWSPMRLGF